MSVKKFYFILVGLVTVFSLSFAGIVYAGNTLLTKQSERLLNAKTTSKVIEDQKVSLKQAKNDIEKYSELDKIAKSVVPQDKDQAKTVLEINKIAEETGITINQISFPTSDLGQKKQAAPKTEGEEGGQKPSQPAAPPITQTVAVPGINGVFSLEIALDTGKNPVSYYKFLEFLERLESNRRTAHVTEISVSPTRAGSDVTFSLTLNAYLKP